ncbi:hypothetical protein SLS53_008525 [Cytospora paraplurivora]|uniref:Frequency clock protein n=1 Tax=Cytospora paraplurivora TaxID=2898453 RepID=A0AAN9TXC3_9PEZI
MDVDPPFYQKQSDSSNEEMFNPATGSAYPFMPPTNQSLRFMPSLAQSSSAEDFRSVIDDLTIENKRLKEALKRYKQFGSDLLRKEKLFEIKVHGLPRQKKRELEATLRDFAASLEGSEAASTPRPKHSPQTKEAERLKGSNSKLNHASSSYSSHPVDSAYASMSNGASSVGHTAGSSTTNILSRPGLARTRSSADRRVESYLQDIPQGLFPRSLALTERDKKKVVVRRLEQLFTGKMPMQRNMSRNQSVGGLEIAPSQTLEPHREALIGIPELGEPRHTHEDMFMSPPNFADEDRGDRTGSGASSNELGGNSNQPRDDLPEQRATRPRDLDPDRVQVPSDNMQYIRHLGVTAPESLSETRYTHQDVSMDAEGWIHLNLLCSLAQLHILNVTPDYIRSAVSEKSTKFQLSRDGKKIRWRGGMEGTKFSSDSSGGSSQRSPDTEATDVSNEEGQRKRQKIDGKALSTSSRTQTYTRPRNADHSSGFHYKPLFSRKHSSSAETSMDDTASEIGALGNSNWSPGLLSDSGSPTRRKRRHDGAIIYYNGAPFCTDLSGDPGDLSPTTYLASSSQDQTMTIEEEQPEIHRTLSGSSLPFCPLVDGPEQLDLEDKELELITDEADMSDKSDDGFGFSWCDEPGKPQLRPLEARFEPFGLGGVTPDDHFAVVVVTRHPINHSPGGRPGMSPSRWGEKADAVASRISSLTTRSLHTSTQPRDRPCEVQFQVVAQRYKQLRTLPLPPPAMFYPPFTDTTESGEYGIEESYSDDEDSAAFLDDSEEVALQQAHPHHPSEYYGQMGTSDSDDESMGNYTSIAPNAPLVSGPRAMPSTSTHSCGSSGIGVELHPVSSGATAGGASGYDSSYSNTDDDE